MDQFAQTRQFILRNARPLDAARWDVRFEGGDASRVLCCLKAYQNEDGGFGHALELDCHNPNSTPVQTWAATRILSEIGFYDASHPLVAGILRYLEDTEAFDGHLWAGLNDVQSNDDYPHAPWWGYDANAAHNYNPTASLIGFVLRCARKATALYARAERLLEEAYAYLLQRTPLESMHEVSCFVEMIEDLKACGRDEYAPLVEAIKPSIQNVLASEPSLWGAEYCCKPSQFVMSRESSFYPMLSELCKAECEFIAQTRDADGTWRITWDWGCYPKSWAISKNWWKADIAIKNCSFLKAFGEYGL